MLFFLASVVEKASKIRFLSAGHKSCFAVSCQPISGHLGSVAVLTGVLKPSDAVTTTTSAPIFILPNGTFVVELVIFIVVFGILARFILPPITKAMKEREELLSASLSGVTEAKAEAAKLLADADQLLSEARFEARQIIEEASDKAASMANKARSDALSEYEKEFSLAQLKITNSREELSKKLEAQAEKLIADITKSVIPMNKISISKAEAVKAYALAKEAGQGSKNE